MAGSGDFWSIAPVTNPTPTRLEDPLALIARRMRIIAEPTGVRLLLVLERRQGTVQEFAKSLFVGEV